MLLDGTHDVVTPEYVEFHFPLAGIYSRFLAWLLDQVIVIFGTVAVLTPLSILVAAFPGFQSALSFIVWFLVDWGYGIALETAWSGQTVGKRAMGLRVIQESGVRIGFYQAALRNLLRAFDRLPLLYIVGGVAALVTDSQQRLGDLVAGTIVIRERRLKIPAAIAEPPAEAFSADALFATKVSHLSREERDLVLSAAMRRDELSMEARLELFAKIAQRLSSEHDLYKPEHLSDEKLVLWVASLLAGKRAVSTRSPPRR